MTLSLGCTADKPGIPLCQWFRKPGTISSRFALSEEPMPPDDVTHLETFGGGVDLRLAETG